MTTIVTLELEAAAQARFEVLRQRHFPAALNRIPAHVSLFHSLPGDRSTGDALRKAAERTAAFDVWVTGLKSLGRGVAYWLASEELSQLRRELADEFAAELIPQDRQRFQPHIVVQNKTDGATARALLAELERAFKPERVRAEALLWWEYLGGPWRLIERFGLGGN